MLVAAPPASRNQRAGYFNSASGASGVSTSFCRFQMLENKVLAIHWKSGVCREGPALPQRGGTLLGGLLAGLGRRMWGRFVGTCDTSSEV